MFLMIFVVAFIPNYICYFTKSIIQHNLKLDDNYKCQYHYILVFSMSSFTANDCCGETWHAGYQRFAVLLGDFSDPNFLDCLHQVLNA